MPTRETDWGAVAIAVVPAAISVLAGVWARRHRSERVFEETVETIDPDGTRRTHTIRHTHVETGSDADRDVLAAEMVQELGPVPATPPP